MVIYFLKFLPKVNRIVRRYDNIASYENFIIQDIGPLDATNFPYNDSITTEETYNFNSYESPDYAIIVDEQGNVTSRWYIEELRYKRNGQCRVSFRRDVLADYRSEVLNATALIEKATVSDNDPAIYNQEGISFNQIKSQETLLKDETGSAWLVGYLSSDSSADKKYNASSSLEIKRSVAGIENWEYYQYISGTFYGSPKSIGINVKVKGNNSNEGVWITKYAFNKNGATTVDVEYNQAIGMNILYANNTYYQYPDSTISEQSRNVSPIIFEAKKKSIFSIYTWSMYEIYDALLLSVKNHQSVEDIFKTQVGLFHSETDEGQFRSLDGTKIYDSINNKTYIIHIDQTLSNTKRYYPTKGTALYNEVKNILTDTEKVDANNIENTYQDIYVKYLVNTYSLSLEEVESDTVSVEIPGGRRILTDAPYSMFAMPYNIVDYKIGGTVYTSDPTASIAIARQISMELMSSGALYDLQILPYCPRRDLIDGNKIDLTYATEDQDYTLIKDSQEGIKGFMIFAKESSFDFDIQHEIDITEKKLQNQCDTWRLCSPNYNGVFEFNAAKNDGVSYFNVDCTYRPYNPYIHVNPNFKALYGNDYDDARGLICSGDFSMPACTEKWLEYEAQNKNYQNSFDRSIQHIEIEQKYQRINQIAGAVAGIGTGAVGGGVIGGIPGAIAGGALSSAGGIADVIMGEKLRTENIRYAKDQFSFSLENIKAMPNSLAKISAFNKNNKIFPFLEYYTCTEIEKQAFRDVIKYDGMTVNRVGKIIDFLTGTDLMYIKARLIRSDELHDDAHIVDVIASEMEKGAYYDTGSN